MNIFRPALFGFAVVLLVASAARAQPRPYIGYVYPAGVREGTTVEVLLGGQGLDDVHAAAITGEGVTAKIIEYRKILNAQEQQLLREQLDALKQSKKQDEDSLRLKAKVEKRLADYVPRPACASIANLVVVEVTAARRAPPGERELRLITPRGASNPLIFCVGQLPVFSRKPLNTCPIPVLGKEELALRNRPDDEVERTIEPPCIVNGQIAPGEVNRYRFKARRGHSLVISTAARRLVPYIADAVPGWFQPVLSLRDAEGKELAYDDDYRIRPYPVILVRVPRDGEYVLTIHDALYRGREDFVYRMEIGDLPFLTSIFPLGGRAGEPPSIDMKGWNLLGAQLVPPAADAAPGIHSVVARRRGVDSNSLPFQIDVLPERFDAESPDDSLKPQRVEPPVIVNGRIDVVDDWDVFEFAGRAGETVIAEVTARRLDSPLDSLLKLTDADGKVLAYNDDCEDLETGLNTHHADSYLSVRLPADGTYRVWLGDAARRGGEEYAYRLRIGPPRPGFALRVVPSSIAMRSKGTAAVTVYAIRKDGYDGPIWLELKDPPEGFSASKVALQNDQEAARFTIKTTLTETDRPVDLTIIGRGRAGIREIDGAGVAAEDRMQAFLWRHLVPAQDFKAVVVDPARVIPPKRARRASPPKSPTPQTAAAAKPASDGKTTPDGKPPQDAKPPEKPKFTKQQVAGRLRQINYLFDEGLLTEEFAGEKIAECEAAQ